MIDSSVSERLVAFVRAHWSQGVPAPVLHEARRLVLNQLKASVGAKDSQSVRILHDWATQYPPSPDATRILWFGTRAAPEQAAVVNGALFEVLDFNDTYIPCFMHAVSGVLPAVLAAAESSGHSGRATLNALALGIEAELACATMLMPTGYFRGFVPGGITGAIGGAVACGLLAGLDDMQLRHAIGMAMFCGFGTYQSAGSMALPAIVGLAARNGLTIARLAARGLDAPRLAFEGDKGMLSAYADEKAEKIAPVLDSLGTDWRIFGQSYKTVPTETITHAPLDCIREVLPRAAGRQVARMRFGVEAIVVKIADERMARFGVPDSELTAKFDTRFCAAAAWIRGHFTLDEMRAPAYTDPAILDLRARIELVADPAHATFDGASLDVFYTDGTTDHAIVPDFRGSPKNRLSDDELSDLFRQSAAQAVGAARIDRILDAVWSLEDAPEIGTLMSLLQHDAAPSPRHEGIPA